MRVSGLCMTTPLSSATCQFITHNQQAFRHDTIGSTLVHRTIVTSPFVRYSVAATPAGRLSARERNTMTRKRRRIRLRKALHIPVTALYTPQLLLVSLRTRISLRGGSTGHRQPAQLVPSLSQYGHQSAYCCGSVLGPNRVEPGLLYAPGAGLFLFGFGR